MDTVTYEDIRSQLKSIPSAASFANSRTTINDNFRLFSLTLSSIWETVGAFYDVNTGQLGSVGLHSDVDLLGANVPQIGEGMVWNGIGFVPNLVGSGGGGGGGAASLTDLIDVASYSYPLADLTILQYNLGNNQFEPVLLSTDSISDIQVDNVLGTALIIKDSNDIIVSLALGANGSFLKSVGGVPTFGFVNLEDIGDLSVPAVLDANTFYFLDSNGTNFNLTSEFDKYGWRDFIPNDVDITIREEHQLIVHQNLTIEGSIDIEGELIII